MAERVQSAKSHARLLAPFHFFVMPVLLINLGNTVRYFWYDRTLHDGFQIVFAAALLMAALMSRVQALTVQDRVIRLEMRLRLKQVLPADLQARINDLTARQLVALRFAGDAEMTDLVREVLAGKLQTGKEIKQRVKNWQADWQRA